MAIQTTQWAPDTCACIIEFTWDDAVPVAARAFTASNIINQCAFHALMEAAPDRLARLFDENRRKNQTIGIAQAAKAGINLDIVTYSYDADRIITVNFQGQLTNQQRNTVQNQADIQFGPGKVIVIA